MNRLWLIALIIGFMVSNSFAGEEGVKIDKETWKRQTKGISYTPEQEEKKERQEEEVYEEARDPAPLPDLSGFKYIAYVVVGLVIIMLLVMIIKNMRPVSQVATERVEATSIEEAEENLPMVALTKIYQEALDLNDYKRALRIKFLMILQRLIDAEMIVWKKRKTNQQYLLELTDKKILGMFARTVNMFDDIWYGEAHLTLEQYGEMAKEFDQLKDLIVGEERE